MTVRPKPVSIELGIISSGFFISSPYVASLEYPVNAKNQIEADRNKLLILNPSSKGT